MNPITFIYSSNPATMEKILEFAFPLRGDSFHCFEDFYLLRAYAKQQRPRTVLIFAPRDADNAIEAKTYIRAVLPNCCVRILPTNFRTDEILEPYWRKAVLQAFKIPLKTSRHLYKGDSK
jgi:hypothetical protein